MISYDLMNRFHRRVMGQLPSKCILVLLDGLADRSHESLGGRTPLQAAQTPNLDRLAQKGACGYFHALSPGTALPSEAAHFFMMGYPPEQFPGRGYLEALGFDLTVEPGQVACLAHLAMCKPESGRLVLQERKPALDQGLAEELFAAVRDYKGSQGSARLVRTKGSSGVLILGGAGLSRCITDSDPLIPGHPLLKPLPWAGQKEDLKTRRTASLLASYLVHAHQALAQHPLNLSRGEQGLAPVNGVITQRAGQATNLEPVGLRWGLKVLSISSAPIYRGVFRALGAAAELLPEDDDPGRDLANKIDAALAELDRYDFIHVHSKAPDETAHTKDPAAKSRIIESLDAGLAELSQAAGGRGDLLIAVTGDHATPSSGQMVHSGENSPLLLHGAGVWRDAAQGFDEVQCATGALGLLRGPELMQSILDRLDRGKLWGMRDNPSDLPYYPGPREPLLLPRKV
jgi:2,3-bisphosphoglycerate-independent phosphoglycerate mutase